jgi:DNA-binding XRE family transcriptional regulator
MNHDLLHIQGKPYVLVPLHEYRALQNNPDDGSDDLPSTVLDSLITGTAHPVKILRTFRNMTQAELAQNAGISRPYLTEIETGRKDGTVNTMRALASALGVGVGRLVAA